MPSRTIDTAALRIDLESVPHRQIVSGEPQAGATDVGTVGGASVGVWTHTPGVSTDVEVEELSVIVSGEATVVINETETVHLVPGTLLRLHEGDRTVWTVTETLRKVYVIQ
jgi:uncharacterized cupin superfamily protein